MEEAVLAAESKGIRARMLLVTNPGNPLGTLYPEATLKVINEIGHFLNLVLMDEASNNYKKRGGGGPACTLCLLQACLYEQELLLWAVKRGLHVLSDEIYANSKFGLVLYF